MEIGKRVKLVSTKIKEPLKFSVFFGLFGLMGKCQSLVFTYYLVISTCQIGQISLVPFEKKTKQQTGENKVLFFYSTTEQRVLNE